MPAADSVISAGWCQAWWDSLARQIKTKGFRHALAVPQNASLYIGPEGGLHHAVASVGVAAVVLFGDFIPPAVTGYSHHANLTGGGDGARKMG
jgi:hypothetical protein